MLDGGRPFSTTLPAATLHVGWVIVPAVGAVGVAGWALITTLPDDDETHPDALITVYVLVPEESPDRIVLAPVPVLVTPPGVRINVHVPDDGKLFNTTLPVAIVHVGCVMVPTVGAGGVGGWVVITTLADDDEIHPDALVTVYV